MRNSRILTSLASLALVAAGFAQTRANPKAVLDEIAKTRKDAVAQAAKDKRALDYQALDKQLAEIAKRAAATVDPAKIDPDDAYLWMQVFDAAELREQAIALAEKAAVAEGNNASDAQQIALSNLVALGKTDQVLTKLAFMSVPTYKSLSEASQWVQYELMPKYIDTNPRLVLDAYDVLLSRMNPHLHPTGDQAKLAALADTDLTIGRSAALFYTGKRREALSNLAKLKTTYAKDPLPFEKATAAYNQLALIDKPAPEIKFDRTLNGFSSLASLKGKVVVLDYFAHWCGPCKRAFPEMRATYRELHDKGLEIVGVTGYYGYYAQEKNLKPDVEFSRMQEFVPMQGLTWPIAFTDKDQKAQYGVTAIPHTVVIDRKGIVRYVEIGTGSAPDGQLRKVIEKYLAE